MSLWKGIANSLYADDYPFLCKLRSRWSSMRGGSKLGFLFSRLLIDIAMCCANCKMRGSNKARTLAVYFKARLINSLGFLTTTCEI